MALFYSYSTFVVIDGGGFVCMCVCVCLFVFFLCLKLASKSCNQTKGC